MRQKAVRISDTMTEGYNIMMEIITIRQIKEEARINAITKQRQFERSGRWS